jgi:hypothetical protein
MTNSATIAAPEPNHTTLPVGKSKAMFVKEKMCSILETNRNVSRRCKYGRG